MRQRIFIIWLPIALTGTILAFVFYAGLQQNIRLSANDPQIQMAEDGGAYLASGGQAQYLVGASKVDISTSLAPFIIIYDSSGKVLASSGQIGNAVPVIPSGVLDYAKIHSDDRLTWQPNGDVRIAAVVKYFNGNNSGYILAGRSLREIESREVWLETMIGIGWIAMLVVTLLVIIGEYYVEGKEHGVN